MYILEVREIQRGRSGPGVLRTSGEVAVTRESEHSCGRWCGLRGS